MKKQASFSKLVVNPVFYVLWQGVYTLVVFFLSLARMGLALRELFFTSVQPRSAESLTVRPGLFGTPAP